MQITEREWLSVKDFAHRYGFGKAFVYQIVRKGSIPSVKLRGKILVPSDALDLLLENKNPNADKPDSAKTRVNET